MRNIIITIGLNQVNPKSYNGWIGKLNAPEKDAVDIGDVFRKRNYEVYTLLGKNATINKFIDFLHALGTTKEDNLIIFYSGHGTQVPDRTGDELDMLDEAWCMYDGLLIDDYINLVLRSIELNQALIISDSCNSGTIAKGIKSLPLNITNEICHDCIDQQSKVNRSYEFATGISTYPIYSISGSQDHEFSYDGIENSVLTAALLIMFEENDFRRWDEIEHFLRLRVSRQTPVVAVTPEAYGLETTPFIRNNSIPLMSSVHNFNCPNSKNKTNMILNNSIVSWKTTLGGILLGLPPILTQLSYYLDADPNTLFSLPLFMSAIGAVITGAMAKDGDKSTEQIKKGWSLRN